jgi:ribosomal protein L10
LRRLLRGGDFEYRIVKNTLAKIASMHTPVSIANDFFKGPVGIGISYDNPVQTAKKMLEYSKKNEKLKIDIGVIEGSLCTSDDLKAFAELPPREVLLSMFAGGFKAPLNKLAYAFNATLTMFVYVLEALKTKKGSQ